MFGRLRESIFGPRPPAAFRRLLKAVNRDFGRYRPDENDCSDYARRCAELAPRYGVIAIVRVFRIRGNQRHAAVEYKDDDGQRWIGDVIYRRPVEKRAYKRRVNSEGL